ncbi:hypothetical protein HYW35_02270 [Candidatus Saccharibacteria bacterium]|nr:hypothetical protein [Candidatus Saccharibacteria bacterium]
MNVLAQLISGDNLPKTSDQSLKTGLTITFSVIGAVGFLFLVIAGVRYVFARGDTNKLAEAKNMIQHIIIGLIIAALAASIVAVVVSRVQ